MRRDSSATRSAASRMCSRSSGVGGGARRGPTKRALSKNAPSDPIAANRSARWWAAVGTGLQVGAELIEEVADGVGGAVVTQEVCFNFFKVVEAGSSD